MEALRASYGGNSSDSDSDCPVSQTNRFPSQESNSSASLPPPPLSLLNSPDKPGSLDCLQSGQAVRIRSFPHVEGNYALHVYIPVRIPTPPRRELAQFFRRVASLVPGLHAVDIDIPADILCKDEHKFEQVALGREFHISLGRTVPIRVHQIGSVVAMLRQKLHRQQRYWIDFGRWEMFVNDDQTRSFLSLEVIAGGLTEIVKQVQAVDEIYKLHNLPEFYKDPRPHISIAWALGDISSCLKRVLQEEMKKYVSVTGLPQTHIFGCPFSGIECKIGNKVHKIC